MPRTICENCHYTMAAPDYRRPPMHHQVKPITVPICPACHKEIAA